MSKELKKFEMKVILELESETGQFDMTTLNNNSLKAKSTG